MTKPKDEAGESALVLHVPEAEELVGRYRWEHDPVARLGVPAHITLIYPFIPPALISKDDLEKLAGILSGYPAFTFSLTSIERFPGVLFLAPSPNEEIVELIKVLAAAFPNYPPYGGQFTEIHPHLTVAQSNNAILLEKIADELSSRAALELPISKKATEASLFEQYDGLWSKTGTFPLKPS